MRRCPTVTRRERGAALVEFAILVPVLALIVFGTFEAGLAIQDTNVLSRSIQQAARTGSGLADGRAADYEALRSLDSSLSGLRATTVEKVIVYDASVNADGSVPEACTDAVRPDDLSVVIVADTCNVYSPTQLQTDDLARFSGSCAGAWDRGFCPTTRNRAGDNPDKLGIFVQMRYDSASAFFPGTLTLDRSAVFQLEPCVAGDPTC